MRPLAPALLAACVLGCGDSGSLSAGDRAVADAKWRAQFGSLPAHRGEKPFSMSARRDGDVVVLKIRVGSKAVSFSDSMLGARLMGYAEGEWKDVGDRGAVLPVVTRVAARRRREVRFQVRGEADLHRVVVLALDRERAAYAWVEVPPRSSSG